MAKIQEIEENSITDPTIGTNQITHTAKLKKIIPTM